MAPEQCEPQSWPGGVGTPADIWGLGATLFHAAAGERPFPASGRKDSDRERYPQLFLEPIALPDRLPVALRDLILNMLHKDPRQRPTAREVAAALEPLEAVTEPSTRRGYKRRRGAGEATEHFPDDLIFDETDDRENFQGRYVLRHPWLGGPQCEEARAYQAALPHRFEREAQRLATVTNGPITEIQNKMTQNGKPIGNPRRAFEGLRGGGERQVMARLGNARQLIGAAAPGQ